MKIKYWIGAVLAAAIVLVAVAWNLDSKGAPSTITLAGPSATIASSEGASSPTNVTPSPRVDASPTSTPNKDLLKESGEPRASATRPSWDPSETASDDALEVPEPTATSKLGLPESRNREPSLESSPPTGTAEGKLTAGFPTGAVPLPDDSTIIKSSVENQSGLVFVGADARTAAKPEEVLTFYREQFDQKEWLSVETTPVRGTKQLQGSFGPDSMTVTIRQLPTGVTALTAAGAFNVGSSRVP